MLEGDLESSVLGAMWFSRIENGRLTEPMPEENRTVLLTRFAYLDDAFLQHGLITDIYGLLQAFPFGKHPTAESYLFVLNQERPAPRWAVTDACMRARRGELGEKSFAPLPSLLRASAWGIALPFWQERCRLAKVLAAKEPAIEAPYDKRREITEKILDSLRLRGFPVKKL